MRSIKPVIIVTAAIVLCGAAAAQQPDAERVTAIRCGRFIDGRTAQAQEDMVILIRGERVAAVGKAASLTIPRDATIIDLSRATVLPGLIDAHSHIIPDVGYTQDSFLKRSSALNAIEGLVNAQKSLAAGFTTLRDPGDMDLYYAHFVVRDAINRGIVQGPRIVAAGHMLSITGGHGDFNNAAPEMTSRLSGTSLTGWKACAGPCAKR